MDCREFYEKHVAFVDDTLAGVELARMQEHIVECGRCAMRDAKIRRSLMLVRSLPSIEPSTGFSARLQAKLQASLATQIAPRGIRKTAGIAMSLAVAAMLGYIALTLYHVESPRDVVLSPVLATVPGIEIAPVTTDAIVASAPAGVTIWPAALFAEQAPVHFARVRFAEVSSTR